MSNNTSIRRRYPLGAALAPALLAAASSASTEAPESAEPPHPYVGMWITDDGYIRHELLPNGRYDEARGNRKSAYQGNYKITGTHIEYVDDKGFTADGDFVDDVLYHAGMVLRRSSTHSTQRSED